MFKVDYRIYFMKDGNYRKVDSNLLSLLMRGIPDVSALDEPVFIDHGTLHRVPVCGEVYQHKVLARNTDSSITNSIMPVMWT